MKKKYGAKKLKILVIALAAGMVSTICATKDIKYKVTLDEPAAQQKVPLSNAMVTVPSTYGQDTNIY